MRLLIDVGNTRIKWAFVDHSVWLQQGHVAIKQLTQLAAQWQGFLPSEIIGCCVAEQAVIHALEALVQQCFALPIAWVRVSFACCGVINHYKNIGQAGEYHTTLGPDRWAALIAVHHHYLGHRVVVNVGTAMTVDALTAHGEFLGGMILPGIHLMQFALNRNTAQLPYSAGQYDPFPKTTEDAIYTGILTALSSAIDRVAKRLAEQGFADVQCIVSGGDAKRVAPYLTYPCQVVDELVLQGLMVIAQNDAAVWQQPDKSVGK
jgi:type III pantothenate kinase